MSHTAVAARPIALYALLTALTLSSCVAPTPAGPTAAATAAASVTDPPEQPADTADAGAGRSPPADATATPARPALTETQRTAIFNQAWEIINQTYLYPDFRGLDWPAVRNELEPQAAAASDQAAFYAVMNELTARLRDNHSRFVPPSDVLDEDALVSGRNSGGALGLIVEPIADGGFVQNVIPDSPAAEADIRPRDRISTVDGHSYRAADGDLRGPSGSTVKLSITRPGSRPRDLVLTRREVQGMVAPYARRFPGDIGYVWVTTLWPDTTGEQVSGALTELAAAGPLQGVILDLRGNDGGWEHVLSGILSHFVRGQVGVFYSRSATRPLVVPAPAGPDLRGRPLVVLVDAETTSYAEVMAAILQREAGAHVVGVTSAGNTETIYAHPLSDGSRLWVAQEGFRLQNGTELEGHGVQPDVSIPIEWRKFSEEDDPQLLEALRLLGAGPK